MTTSGATWGTVSRWSEEEGWGVVDANQTPGGCFARASAVEPAGASLRAGEVVDLEWEADDEGEYRFRARRVALRTEGQEGTLGA